MKWRCDTPPPTIRDGETTIKIIFAREGGNWGHRGALSKNAVFRGKRHDNKILKVQILLSNILLSLRRLLHKRGISAILARYPMKTRQMGAIPPSAILFRFTIRLHGRDT